MTSNFKTKNWNTFKSGGGNSHIRNPANFNDNYDEYRNKNDYASIATPGRQDVRTLNSFPLSGNSILSNINNDSKDTYKQIHGRPAAQSTLNLGGYAEPSAYSSYGAGTRASEPISHTIPKKSFKEDSNPGQRTANTTYGDQNKPGFRQFNPGGSR